MNDGFDLKARGKVWPAGRPPRNGRDQVSGFDHFLFVEAEIMARCGAEGSEIRLIGAGQVAGKAGLAPAVRQMRSLMDAARA